MVRRDRWRVGLLSASAALADMLAPLAWWRGQRLDEFSDHMLRDIGFIDGRMTEAGMRRAADRHGGFDRF